MQPRRPTSTASRFTSGQRSTSPVCDDDSEASEMPKRRFLTQDEWLMERHVNDWPAAALAQSEEDAQ